MTAHDSLDILYLDNHLIAVNKPFGLPTQSERTDDPSLLEQTRSWIKTEYHKPGNVFLGMVHRLDQPVAGVVVFARTSKAASRLSAQFRERTTQKIYQAVVENQMEHSSGTLVAYLKKEKSRKTTVYPRPAPEAKQAELSYRVIKTFPHACVLEIIPQTGRFHQIRAQLAFVGHPIIGDVKYGARSPLLPAQNIALYARELIFNHPITGERVTIQAPKPPGWPFIKNPTTPDDNL
ncbi:MAG: RNA pseudouridine synthase [Nitrospinae bacterium RIFCSPLOWO2_12_FULL_47_7]|nr:MAG: RNA pseudouridine synthase [Nitrospinae bacterium RIFCSPLOWO2_12_FULL_47_7]